MVLDLGRRFLGFVVGPGHVGQGLVADGNGVVAGGAATGNYPVLYPGKENPAAGKELPPPATEKADIERLAGDFDIASMSISRDLRFQVDLDKGSAVIQVIDRETGEIIRQIPQEKVALDLNVSGSVQIRLLDDLV